MEKLFQIHLNAPLMCQRGVRFRLLPPDVHRSLEAETARQLAQDATRFEYRDMCVLAWTRAMIREITEPIVARPTSPPDASDEDKAKANAAALSAVTERLADPASWRKVTLQDLCSPTGELNFDKIFGVKDQEYLRALYNMHHECTPMEIGLLSGKAIPVSTEG